MEYLMKKNIEPLFIGLNECDPDIEYIRALVECENGDHEKELSILVNVFHESRESKERTKCALFILIAFTCSSHHLDQKYLRDLVLDRLSQIDCDYFIQKLIERVNQRNSKNKWIEDVKKLVFRERYTFYDNMEYFCCDVVELVEACNDKRPSEQIESLLPKLYLRLAAKFSDDIKKENLDKANRYYETKETSLSLDEKIFYFVQMTTVGADQLILKSMSNLKDVIKSMKEKIEDNSLLIEQPFQFQEARLYEALSQAAARSGKHTKRERNRLKAIRRFAEMDENLKSYLEQKLKPNNKDSDDNEYLERIKKELVDYKANKIKDLFEKEKRANRIKFNKPNCDTISYWTGHVILSLLSVACVLVVLVDK